ncbi:MAG: hypothetical protein AB9869_11435 [Verrucomicrobiia bacterium]
MLSLIILLQLNMKKYVFVSLVVTAFLAWTIFTSQRSAPQPPSEPEAEAVTQTSAEPKQGASGPLPDCVSFIWKVGDHGTWLMQTSLRLASPEDPEAAQLTAVSCKLEMEVLTVAPDEVRVLAVLQNPQCQTAGEAVPALAALLEETVCLLTLEPCGKLRTLAFPAAVAEDDRGFLKMVFGWPGFIVLRPQSRYVEQEAENEDLGAEYCREGQTVTKSRFWRGAKAGNYQEILASRFCGRIGHLWLAALEGSEETEMVLNQSPFLRGTVWVTLNEIESSQGSPLLAQWRDQTSLLTSTAHPGAHSVSAALRMEAMKERWTQVPLADMTSALKPGVGMRNMVGPLKNLREWILVHDLDGVTEVISLLNSPEMEADLAGILTHALATSEGEAARAGHVLILQNPDLFTEAAVIQALISAGQQEEAASPVLMEAMRELLKTHDDPQGILVLNAAALARHDTEMAEVLVNRVLPDLADDTGTDRGVLALRALRQARIAVPEAVATAERWEVSPDTELRFAAVDYLYHVSETPDIFATQYLLDKDVRIRGLFQEDPVSQ